MSNGGPEVTLELLQRALEVAGIVFEVTDSDGRIVDVNRHYVETTGYDRSEAIGRTPAQLGRSNEHPDAYFDAIWNRISGGDAWSGPMVSRRKDGRLFQQHVSIQPVLSARGDGVDGFVTLKKDITEQASVTMRHRALFDAASDAILVSDFDSALIIEANLAACALFGYRAREWVTLTGRDLCSTAESAAVAAISAQINETGMAESGPIRMVRKDGSEFWADFRVSAFRAAGRTRMVSVIRDISSQVARNAALRRTNAELLRVHEQLVHAGKLAAIGRLARGVAHQVNNPAQYVLLNLTEANEILRGPMGPSERAELIELMSDATDGMRRIADLTRDLLGLSRLELTDLDALDLADIAHTAVNAIPNAERALIEIALEAGDNVKVHGDRQRLTDTVTGLIQNAVDALSRVDRFGPARRGRIVVLARQRGDEAVLTVRDNGPGMDAETVEQAVEPFFTTKDVGLGKGLGLPLAVETVRKHGGRLTVQSIPDVGTTVEIILPLVDEVALEGRRQTKRRITSRVSSGGRERVLVVDDSALVLRTFKRLLRRQFQVVTAESGREAVTLLQGGERYAAVLCDLHMPGFDGIDVYEAIAPKRADLADRFIFCTGAAITDRVRHFLDRTDLTLLAKPVEPPTLLQAIADVVASTMR